MSLTKICFKKGVNFFTNNPEFYSQLRFLVPRGAQCALLEWYLHYLLTKNHLVIKINFGYTNKILYKSTCFISVDAVKAATFKKNDVWMGTK